MAGAVVFIVGPTAVGKSSSSEELAVRFRGAILNCDSVQAYREVEIGTAKPSSVERQRCPHLCFDLVSPPAQITAADFRLAALRELAAWTPRGPVFAVGGSGFYIRALTRGMFSVAPVPEQVTNKWRSRLEQEGGEALHRVLTERDPVVAKRIKSQDSYRLLRALSVIESEGRPLSEIEAEFNARPTEWPYRTLKIGLKLDRGELKQRIRSRAEQMVARGLRDEVERLLGQGLASWPPLSAVGYRETVAALRLGWSDAQLVEAITLATTQLAKRQMTWFRRDPEIEWYSALEDSAVLTERVRQFLQG